MTRNWQFKRIWHFNGSIPDCATSIPAWPSFKAKTGVVIKVLKQNSIQSYVFKISLLCVTYSQSGFHFLLLGTKRTRTGFSFQRRTCRSRSLPRDWSPIATGLHYFIQPFNADPSNLRFYFKRLMLRVYCSLNVRNFPFDQQNCRFYLESCIDTVSFLFKNNAILNQFLYASQGVCRTLSSSLFGTRRVAWK